MHPFDIATKPATLVSIATGMHVTAEIQCSLLEALTSVKKQDKSFVSASRTVGGTNSSHSHTKKPKTLALTKKKVSIRYQCGTKLSVQ